MSTTSSPTAAAVEVTARDLQGHGAVFCPNPKMPLWSNHPRVFLEIAQEGEAKCPYCGTVYRLKAGEKLAGGH
ncbi:MAG TPA: zinc-finger domain-containing protein [Ideonella sp.]|jgi:uncharacterized Zn-finger protein|nr:zinc-finger domain-containing protein [Ideonella sp.]